MNKTFQTRDSFFFYKIPSFLCVGSGSVSVAWSAGIALSKVRRIQQVSRCSLNCVLLAAVSGAVRVLLQGCGVRQPPDLQVRGNIQIF